MPAGFDESDRTLYVLINNRLDPVFEVVAPHALDIAGRSLSTLITSQAAFAHAHSRRVTAVRPDLVPPPATSPAPSSDATRRSTPSPGTSRR